jgi:hypothetical protein
VRQKLGPVPVEDPDIAKTPLLDDGEKFRHAIDEGLAADEADIGVTLGLCREMLAAAEADLEPERARRRAEREPWIEGRVDAQLREEGPDAEVLCGAKRRRSAPRLRPSRP